MKKFINLAIILFDMELESIGNDTQFHFEFNGWLDKFGDKSVEFEPKLEKKDKDVNDLAKILKQDFINGEFQVNDGGLYNYLMPTIYGGFVTERLEQQLADLTGVGTQLEIF